MVGGLFCCRRSSSRCAEGGEILFWSGVDNLDNNHTWNSIEVEMNQLCKVELNTHANILSRVYWRTLTSTQSFR